MVRLGIHTAQFASDGSDTEVGNLGKLDIGNLKALDPATLVLVLEVKLEVFVLEVGQFGLGGDGRLADTASLSLLARLFANFL